MPNNLIRCIVDLLAVNDAQLSCLQDWLHLELEQIASQGELFTHLLDCPVLMQVRNLHQDLLSQLLMYIVVQFDNSDHLVVGENLVIRIGGLRLMSGID